MANIPLAHPGWVDDEETQLSADENFLLGAETARPPRPRFNPAASGRIAGSVAAQRTHEQGLAASGPDGTRVLMPPVARSAPLRATRQGDGTRAKRREHSELHSDPPALVKNRVWGKKE